MALNNLLGADEALKTLYDLQSQGVSSEDLGVPIIVVVGDTSVRAACGVARAHHEGKRVVGSSFSDGMAGGNTVAAAFLCVEPPTPRFCPQAGKSTLLARLTGVDLPTGQDVTTRCPLVVETVRLTDSHARPGMKVWHELQHEPTAFTLTEQEVAGGRGVGAAISDAQANLLGHAGGDSKGDC